MLVLNDSWPRKFWIHSAENFFDQFFAFCLKRRNPPFLANPKKVYFIRELHLYAVTFPPETYIQKNHLTDRFFKNPCLIYPLRPNADA